MLVVYLTAQNPPANKPTTMEEAKAIFLQAYELEKQQKFDEALARYSLALPFFQTSSSKEINYFAIVVLNNISGILVNQGNYIEAINTLKNALELASKIDDFRTMAELYHKLGIIYSQYAAIDIQKAKDKNNLTPDAKKLQQLQRILLSNGSYVRQGEENFGAERIRLSGAQNPFVEDIDLYNKLANLKVTSDFSPNELLVPDNVTYRVRIEKKGYHPIDKTESFSDEKDYWPLDEIMYTIPRAVEAKITEDLYHRNLAVDELSLSPFEGAKIGQSIAISDTGKTFKPNKYRLIVKRRGYEPIIEDLVIPPGEGPYKLERELRSALRQVKYQIMSDFSKDIIKPDEITLNGQLLPQNQPMKPGKYKLQIRKDGYDVISRDINIDPADEPYYINEEMKSLPREIIFQITGDYQKDEPLMQPDVTFNSRKVSYGEAIKPGIFRVEVRKPGYDPHFSSETVEPKNEPFILRKMLNSKLRRVELDILAEFPVGQKLSPDRCIVNLNERNVVAEPNFKPGAYTMSITSAGYETINKKINIEPKEDIHIIRETMKAKPVLVKVEITLDIPHDDPNAAAVLTLVNQKNKEIINLKDGDKVPPANYQLKIEMDGYESVTLPKDIYPSEETYLITQRLLAKKRKVISRITAEYPEGKSFLPQDIQNITLGGQSLKDKDFQIKPGSHELMIVHPGYAPIRKLVNISANSTEFLLAERLETLPRTVEFTFRDSVLVNRELKPDEVTVANKPIAEQKVIIKPGVYTLRARLQGYAALDDMVTVPVGGPEVWKEERRMVSVSREVITKITGDFAPTQKLSPDILSLNDTPIGEKASMRPGEYTLTIQKEGYKTIVENINILPEPGPYEIVKVMESLPRKMNVSVKSSYEGRKIIPDTMKLGQEELKDGIDVKPGIYKLEIKKEGHKEIVGEELVIEPSKSPYNLDKMLEALPVMVEYELTNDYNEDPTEPDVITLAGGDMENPIEKTGTPFNPGKYSLKIEKLGFAPIKQDIVIEPSNMPYKITQMLESLPREIISKIIDDLGEELMPIVTLDDNDVTSGPFKPKRYKLLIDVPGYYPVEEEIDIEPSDMEYTLERTLESKPRKFVEKITYDIAPGEELPPYRLTVASTDDPKNEKVIKTGQMLKPGGYIFRITKEAYVPVEVRKRIGAEDRDFTFEYELSAKQVQLKIELTYDIEPPVSLEPYVVSLIDKNGVASFVTDGNRIKPNFYLLDIQRPGYTGGPRQEIFIKPSEQQYLIARKLIAKPRSLSFNMLDEATQTLIKAEQILINGVEAKHGTTYLPGTELDLVAKFKEYKTAQRRIMILPGEGPFVAQVPLYKLVRCDFVLLKNEEIIDGTKYPYQFFLGKDLVEDHQIEIEKSGSRIYYSIRADPAAPELTIASGYFCMTRKLPPMPANAPASFVKQLGMLGRFTDIYVDKLHPKSVGLIEHLDSKTKGELKHREALDILRRMLQRSENREMLKKCKDGEVQNLINYVKNWTFSDKTDQEMHKATITMLEDIKLK